MKEKRKKNKFKIYKMKYVQNFFPKYSIILICFIFSFYILESKYKHILFSDNNEIVLKVKGTGSISIIDSSFTSKISEIYVQGNSVPVNSQVNLSDSENEVKLVKEGCQGRLLKVILETCLLTDEEKIKMCEIVNESGADYIKTSTGFSKGGATLHDVEIFAKYIKAPVKIKAAGGISSIEDAKAFVAAGADRLGTSRIVKIVKSNQ